MTRTKYYLGLFCLLLSGVASGQGMFGAGHCLPAHHPATLLWEDGHVVYGHYQPHFLTKEISDMEWEGCHTFQGNGLSWRIQHIGFSAFGTMECRLGYGRRFGKQVGVVLQGCYLWRHARHYPGVHSFTIHLSMAYQMSQKLLLAVTLYNPIRMRYGIVGQEVIPMSFNVMLRYAAGRTVLLDLNIEKRLPIGFEIGSMAHYTPKRAVSFHLTCSNMRCGVGISVGWRTLRLLVQGDWYYRTGITPSIELLYQSQAKPS